MYKIGDIVWTHPSIFGCGGEFAQVEIVFYQGNGWYMTKMLSTGVQKLIHRNDLDDHA